MLSGSFICQQGNVLKTTLITFNQVLFFVPVPNQKVHFHHLFDIDFVFICLRLKLISRRVVSIIVIDYCHIKLWPSVNKQASYPVSVESLIGLFSHKSPVINDTIASRTYLYLNLPWSQRFVMFSKTIHSIYGFSG
jgi:hypothetical protein